MPRRYRGPAPYRAPKALMQHLRQSRQAAVPQVMRRPRRPGGRDTSSQPSRHRERNTAHGRQTTLIMFGWSVVRGSAHRVCMPSLPSTHQPMSHDMTAQPRPLAGAARRPVVCGLRASRGAGRPRCQPPPPLCRTRPRCIPDRCSITAVQGDSFSGRFPLLVHLNRSLSPSL